MQKLAREIAFHSFVKRMTILVSMLFVLISIASPQQTIAQDDGNSAVHGKGTPNHMAKFKGRNSLQNTAILESNGCVSELPTFNGAEAGFLCLHDFAGSVPQ